MKKLDFLNVNIKRLKDEYRNGQNVFNLVLKETGDADLAVLLSYEIQAGSYIAAIDGPKNTPTYQTSMKQFSELFKKLGATSILEAGVGEGTTLANSLCLDGDFLKQIKWIGGFDISLSRLMFAKKYCANKLSANKNLAFFTGRLEEIPLESSSVDLVFTSHAIEPNFGKESKIVAELFRITKRWLVLREPSFDLGGVGTREHIQKHRYIENLIGAIREMGLNIVEHRLWGYDFNLQNQTSVTVICKSEINASFQNEGLPKFVNPITHSVLESQENFLYDEQGGVAFPILAGLPCLMKEQAILCTHLPKL